MARNYLAIAIIIFTFLLQTKAKLTRKCLSESWFNNKFSNELDGKKISDVLVQIGIAPMGEQLMTFSPIAPVAPIE